MHHRGQICDLRRDLLPNCRQTAARVIVADGSGYGLATPIEAFQQLSLRLFQTVALIIEFLLAPVNSVDHAGEGAVLRALAEILPRHEQAITQGDVDMAAGRVVPMPGELRERLEDIQLAHAALPRPAAVGHVMGIRRGGQAGGRGKDADGLRS